MGRIGFGLEKVGERTVMAPHSLAAIADGMGLVRQTICKAMAIVVRRSSRIMAVKVEEAIPTIVAQVMQAIVAMAQAFSISTEVSRSSSRNVVVPVLAVSSIGSKSR